MQPYASKTLPPELLISSNMNNTLKWNSIILTFQAEKWKTTKSVLPGSHKNSQVHWVPALCLNRSIIISKKSLLSTPRVEVLHLPTVKH